MIFGEHIPHDLQHIHKKNRFWASFLSIQNSNYMGSSVEGAEGRGRAFDHILASSLGMEGADSLLKFGKIPRDRD